jgi:hypothetical protein
VKMQKEQDPSSAPLEKAGDPASERSSECGMAVLSKSVEVRARSTKERRTQSENALALSVR